MRVHDHPLFHDPSRAWGPPLTDALIGVAEGILGVRLPQALRLALARCNGGPLRRTTLRDGLGQTALRLPDLDGIGYGQGLERSAACQREWGFPEGCVVLHTDGPRALMLDYRRVGPEGEPSVIFVDTDEEHAGQPAERPIAPQLAELLAGLRFQPARSLIALQDGLDEDDVLEALQRAGAEGPVRRDHEDGRSLSRPGWSSVEPGVARLRLLPNQRADRTLRYPEVARGALLLESTATGAHTAALWALAAGLCPAPLALHLHPEARELQA